MQKGTAHTDEAKQKMSAAKRGKPKSPETREKMRIAQQARQARNRAAQN
ncbi:hypothetical protein C0214_02930 [Methylobacterium sp. DM1]|nr:hypothetical protein C0214_02930 [Methylobacterium sp. DM1]